MLRPVHQIHSCRLHVNIYLHLYLKLHFKIITHCMLSKNAWLPESNMASATIFNLDKLMLFSYFATNFHQILEMMRLWITTYLTYNNTPCNCNQTWMTTAAILNFEKRMQLSNFPTYFHQIWLGYCYFKLQHIYITGKHRVSGIRNGGCRHLKWHYTNFPQIWWGCCNSE